jgi:4-amino-4-deoxy-L-arabinose transferase-like glycosyltransferase
MHKQPRAVVLGLAVLATVVLYFHGLGSYRSYLSVEEVTHALQAQSIAASGRDLVGRWLPVYPSEPWYEAGRDPLWTYAEAALMRMTSFSEGLIRMPSAAAGVANACLMFLVSRRLFGSEAIAVVAAALLALTPAHFFQSRLATSQIGPVTFVLGALLSLVRYLDARRTRDLFVTGMLLGIGVYSYLSALFLMPLLLLAAWLVVRDAGSATAPLEPQHGFSASRSLFGGFLLAMAPFIVWHLAHPERVAQLLGYYTANGYNADLASSPPAAARIAARVDVWWEAFSPAVLFLTGDGNLRFSTRHSGHFLLPVGILFVIGLAARQRDCYRRVRPFLVTGLLVAPLAAVLALDGEIKRWLAFVPFVILVAGAGFAALHASRRRVIRASAVALVVLSVAQFSGFLWDYWTGYRERSAFYYGGDIGGAVREILANAGDVRCVMIERRVPVLDHWLLYTRMKGLDAEAQRPWVGDAESTDLPARPGCHRVGLLIYTDLASPTLEQSLVARGWTKSPIPESGDRSLLTLFWSDAAR